MSVSPPAPPMIDSKVVPMVSSSPTAPSFLTLSRLTATGSVSPR